MKVVLAELAIYSVGEWAIWATTCFCIKK